jgi:hypothetical protein
MSRKAKQRAATLTSPEAEAAIKGVHEGLEGSMTAFMANVGKMCRTYDQHLQAALPHNPKAHFFDRDGTSPPTSPLMKRPRVDISGMSPLVHAVTPGHKSAVEFQFPASPRRNGSPSTSPKIVTVASATVPDLALPVASQSKDTLLAELGLLKSEARILVKTFDQIHDWIALNIPRMQEEDNGGVEVLGIVIGNVQQMAGIIRQVYALESKYLDNHVDIVTKGLKYGGCASFDHALGVLHTNTWDDVERGWRSLIRACLLLQSVLAKNMKRLKEPRRQRSGMTCM